VVGSLYTAGVYTNRRMSISRSMGAVFVSYVVVSAMVAFFRDYAFSRAVIVLSGALSFLMLPGWRLLVRMMGKSSAAGRKSLFGRRTLIVGTDKAAQEILRRIRSRVADGYQVVGFIDKTRKRIGEELAGLPILGSNDNIGKVIEELRVSDVIFSTQTLPYADILSVISRAGGHAVNFHIVPNTLEVIIGKASVDSLDDLPLVPISYNIEKPLNRALKRLFDIGFSALLLLSVYPFVYLRHARQNALRVGGHAVVSPSRSHIILSLPSVLSGKFSLVGPPIGHSSIIQSNGRSGPSIFLGKPGLMGLVQLQAGRLLMQEESEQYNLYYARNQSVLLDLEIMLKTLFRTKTDNRQPSLQRTMKPTRQHKARGDRRKMSSMSSDEPKGVS
ncbi:MAG: sugar transferase, partial [Bacteroidota bacterium]